jgi:FkbM family methyltransferase
MMAAEMPLASVRIQAGKKSFVIQHADASDHLFKILESTGRFYEIDLLDALARRLKAGDVVLDVGANIGNHTIFFAGVCRCRVIAFEPHPLAFSILKANIKRNRLSKLVDARQMALGEKQAIAHFAEVPEHNLGAAKLVESAEGNVNVIKLDDLNIETLPRLVKIDAEGMELAILQGARKLISTCHPIVCVEASSLDGYERIFEYLREFGYLSGEPFNFTPTHIFSTVAKDDPSVLASDVAHYMARSYINAVNTERMLNTKLIKQSDRLAALEHDNTLPRLDAKTDKLLAELSDLGQTITQQLDHTQLKTLLNTQIQALLEKLSGLESGEIGRDASLTTAIQATADQIVERLSNRLEDTTAIFDSLHRLRGDLLEPLVAEIRGFQTERQRGHAEVIGELGNVLQRLENRIVNEAAALAAGDQAAHVALTRKTSESLVHLVSEITRIEHKTEETRQAIVAQLGQYYNRSVAALEDRTNLILDKAERAAASTQVTDDALQARLDNLSGALRDSGEEVRRQISDQLGVQYDQFVAGLADRTQAIDETLKTRLNDVATELKAELARAVINPQTIDRSLKARFDNLLADLKADVIAAQTAQIERRMNAIALDISHALANQLAEIATHIDRRLDDITNVPVGLAQHAIGDGPLHTTQPSAPRPEDLLPRIEYFEGPAGATPSTHVLWRPEKQAALVHPAGLPPMIAVIKGVRVERVVTIHAAVQLDHPEAAPSEFAIVAVPCEAEGKSSTLGHFLSILRGPRAGADGRDGKKIVEQARWTKLMANEKHSISFSFDKPYTGSLDIFMLTRNLTDSNAYSWAEFENISFELQK